MTTLTPCERPHQGRAKQKGGEGEKENKNRKDPIKHAREREKEEMIPIPTRGEKRRENTKEHRKRMGHKQDYNNKISRQ